MALQGPAFSSALATHCSAQMSPPACLDQAGAQSRIRGCSSREREESKYCRKGQRPFALSDQASLSNCLPRPCHPSGSSGCCSVSPSLLPPTGCSWCLSSVTSCAPAVSTALLCCRLTESSLPPEKQPQRAAKAWFLLGMPWFCWAASLHRKQWHVPGSGAMEDFTRFKKLQDRSFRGGEVEVGCQSKARTTWSSQSTQFCFSEG